MVGDVRDLDYMSRDVKNGREAHLEEVGTVFEA
jgi:hypothetical protein